MYLSRGNFLIKTYVNAYGISPELQNAKHQCQTSLSLKGEQIWISLGFTDTQGIHPHLVVSSLSH